MCVVCVCVCVHMQMYCMGIGANVKSERGQMHAHSTCKYFIMQRLDPHYVKMCHTKIVDGQVRGHRKMHEPVVEFQL